MADKVLMQHSIPMKVIDNGDETFSMATSAAVIDPAKNQSQNFGTTASGALVPMRVDNSGRTKIIHGQPDPVTGILSALGNTVAINVDGFSDVLFYFTGTASFAVTYEQSPDSTNGVDGSWFQTVAISQTAATATPSTGTTFTTATTSFNRVPAPGATWARVRVSSYTSGSLNVNAVATTAMQQSQIGVVVQNSSISTTVPVVTNASTALTRYQNNALTSTSLVKATSGRWHKYHIYNPNATVAYVQVFNVAATASVTLGTTAPVEVLAIPAGGVLDGYWGNSTNWSTGIVIAATTTPTGNTVVATGLLVGLGYI